MMVRAGMHDQNLRSCVSLLDHVRQVMAIVLGQGGPENDEVESSLPQGFLNTLTIEGGSHVMSGFGHLGGLARERLFVGLAVKNFDGCGMSRFLSGSGQRTLLELTRSLTSGEHASEVTEDQGRMADEEQREEQCEEQSEEEREEQRASPTRFGCDYCAIN